MPRHGGCHACCHFGAEYGHVVSRRGILAWRRMEVAYGFPPSAFSVLSVGKVHTCARVLFGYGIQVRTDSVFWHCAYDQRLYPLDCHTDFRFQSG